MQRRTLNLRNGFQKTWAVIKGRDAMIELHIHADWKEIIAAVAVFIICVRLYLSWKE